MADNFDNYGIKVQATVSMPASGDVDKQIKQLEKSISKLKISGKFDDTALKNLTNQLNTLKATVTTANFSPTALTELTNQVNRALQNINIGNINVGNVGNQAQQVGQQIGNNVSQGVKLGFSQSKNAIDSFKESLKKANKSSTEIDSIVEKVQKLNVQIQSLRFTESENKKAKIINVDVSGFDELGNKIKATQTLMREFGSTDWNIAKTSTSIISTKEIEKIENAFVSFTQKIEQFKSTNNGKLSGLTQPLADFETKLAGLKSGVYTIDEVKNAFKLLQAEVSKIDAPLKATIDRFSATKTTIDNGKKSISDYREALKGLNNAPKELSQELTKASKLLMQINNIEKSEGTTANWSIKAREFTDMLTNIDGKIKSLKKQQANGSTETIYSKKDIENLLYVQKILNTVSKTEGELRTKLARAGYTNIKIKGIEDATGKVKELEVTANNAVGALEKINFSRVKVQGGGKSQRIQDWLVQSGDVQILQSATTAQENLSKSAQKASNNLADLKSKWQSQGVLVGEFKTKVEQLETSLASVGSKGELDKLTSQIRSLKDEASQITQLNKIQLLSNGGIKNDYATQIARLEGQFRSLGMVQSSIETKTRGVTSAFEALKTRMSQPFNASNYQEIITLNDTLQRELAESSNEYTRLQASMRGMATEQQRLSLANTIEAWNQKNTAATREVRAENERYVLSLRDLSNQMTRMDFNKINTGFKQNENSMRALNRLGASLKDQFTQAYRSFTMWLSASTMVMKVISETREAFAELKEVNTLLTEISKANENLSKTQLTKIADDGFGVASNYGKKVTDYLSGVQEASRAGYENAEVIAELSTAIQGAGDVTSDIANKYIIATDKAYGLKGSVEELTKVFDGSNYITNKNAVNMTELADGMSIVGSTAASFGIGVNETTAALGTMIATTQQSGSEMARAFRAILLNIKQVSDEEEGIDAEGLTKYEKACNALGVSLKETRNGVLQTRDAMDVLRDLSVEYNKLEENDLKRVNLLNSVGGKLRANALDALLKQHSMYSKMLSEYNQGTGSMAREAEKTAKSWEGVSNRISNTWTDTVENIANSDGIIAILNSFNSLLEVINKTTDALGSFGTIGFGVGITATFKNVGQCV